MTSEQIKSLDKENVLGTYGRFDVVIDHGKGATLYSPEGREYIDFASGIGVNSLGYCNANWIEAISAQAAKLQHVSNLYYTEPCVRLAGAMKARTGMSKVFFANSGAESNEGMIKLARKYSYDKYGKGRSTVISLINSFHGRTVTTLAATGQDVFHDFFFPFTEGFKYVPANDLSALREAVTDDVCAIMFELVQGEGGVLPLNQDFVAGIDALCREKDLLMLVDEVQTGVGRTGTLFAFQQFGIMPDAVSFAKGIGGGLPLGGFMVGEKAEKTLGPGTHATTFGGNPVCCAGALTVLDTLDEAMLTEVREKGQYIRDKITAMGSPYIGDVRGLGLMIGATVKGTTHRELAARMIESGLLILTAGSDSLRMLPPLVISYEEIDKGLEIFKKAVSE